MKLFILFFLLLLLSSCAKEKSVFWCGDHACINKKEKESYFKKNMIVEKRFIKGKKKKRESEFDIVLRQNKINNIKRKTLDNNENLKKISKNEKSLIKEQQASDKIKIKEEKKLAKQKMKEKGKLAKQKIKEEKRLAKKFNKEKRKITQKVEKEEGKLSDNSLLLKKDLSFATIVKNIRLRNSKKPFPNINSNQN